jgi:DHA1 family bicyclomycin/chloramphenicol resistance-like MFS transporter
MKMLNTSDSKAVTRLAFALIPLSGFALDIFIPSLPAMAAEFHTTPANVQLTLSIFLISLGAFQLFIGSVLDSFGRYLPNIIALAAFSISCFIVASTDNLFMIYLMRALQGACVATIIVSKRAILVDLHSGEELKKYMSMLSVVWSAAPIIAPFIGGFLQVHFGWRSNFNLLGALGALFLVIELVMSGETIKVKHPFNAKSINEAYTTMIKAKDFSIGLIILGFAFSSMMVYNMTSPFIIEKLLGLSPAVTGNASLVSGVSLMLGGILSRQLISKPFFTKIMTSIIIMLIIAGLVTGLTAVHPSLITLLSFVIPLHFLVGFIFNSVFSYVLTKFPQFGGKAGGLAGGTYIIMTSVLAQGVVGTFNIKTQTALGFNYIAFTIIILLLFISVKWIQTARVNSEKRPANPIPELTH